MRLISRGVLVAGMVAVVSGFLLAGFSSFAGVLDTLGQTGEALQGSPTPTRSIGMVIGQFIQLFLGFLGIIFLVLILYAGFMWMTAAGEEAKVTKAKNLLQQAVIGLIIVLAAEGVSFWVLSQLASRIGGG